MIRPPPASEGAAHALPELCEDGPIGVAGSAAVLALWETRGRQRRSPACWVQQRARTARERAIYTQGDGFIQSANLASIRRLTRRSHLNRAGVDSARHAASVRFRKERAAKHGEPMFGQRLGCCVATL